MKVRIKALMSHLINEPFNNHLFPWWVHLNVVPKGEQEWKSLEQCLYISVSGQKKKKKKSGTWSPFSRWQGAMSPHRITIGTFTNTPFSISDSKCHQTMHEASCLNFSPKKEWETQIIRKAIGECCIPGHACAFWACQRSCKSFSKWITEKSLCYSSQHSLSFGGMVHMGSEVFISCCDGLTSEFLSEHLHCNRDQ